MKKHLRLLLCTGVTAALLAMPALAADTDSLPAKQGDFYVMVNGEYVTFPDAVPQIRESRSCLPFVAVFDQLGFPEENMTWDASTGTVTAVKPDVVYTSFQGDTKQGDLTVQLTIGSNDISYWYEGNTTAGPHGNQAQVVDHIQSEVAPYISDSRTYIPFGLLADTLGYNVGWDAQIGAVIIDDVDAILAANTETYELMDQYQAYNRTFVEKNQKVTGSYSMDLAVDQKDQETSGKLDLTVDGKYNMITSGTTAFQFDTDMTLDATAVSNGVDVTGLVAAEDGTPILPMELGFDMRGDMADGTFYFNLDSEKLGELTGWDTKNWYKLDLAALFDEMADLTGMNYDQLMELSNASLEEDFSQLLPDMLKQMPLTSVQFTTTDYLELLNTICGDSHFVKSGSSYENTFLNEGGITGTFTLYTSGDKVNGYAMELKADPAVVGAEMTMSIAMKGSKMEMAMNVAASQGEGQEGSGTLYQMDLTLDLAMDGTYQSTSAKPATEPPAGATVVDLMDMMGGALPETLPAA